MPNENSVNDIFRFIQLRPTRLLRETPTIPLLADTPLARELAAALPSRRSAVADAALERGDDIVREPTDVPLGGEIEAAVLDLADTDSTTDDLVDALPGLDGVLGSSQFDSGGRALSNTLLAAFFAARARVPSELKALQRIHRVYYLLRLRKAGTSLAATPLAEFLSRRILTPAFPRGEAAPSSRPRPRERPTTPGRVSSVEAAALEKAIRELTDLDRPENLVAPEALPPLREDSAPARRAVPFTLNTAGRARLSQGTRDVLASHGANLETASIDSLVQALVDIRVEVGPIIVWPEPEVETESGATLPPPPALALVRPAGVADLLVVKQQIKRYEAGEIAHVENVLIGEKKSRAHRRLDRREETFATDQETTRERETELETADRFELNREASQTIKEDQQYGASLSLSGKYGPSVEFTASAEMDISTSSEETASNSSRFAKDVVNRSLDRVTERVREQRSHTTIVETEETNLHELHNETSDHVVGIYQYIDKVYEAQVFNYGVRAMFDFMVPEPASFLWHIEAHPTLDVDIPPAPPKLELVAPDATFITEYNAPGLAATYGATDVELAPPLYKRLVHGVKHGGDNVSESDQPRSVDRTDVQIPAGYRPVRARIRGLALSDQNPVIGIIIGAQHALWRPSDDDREQLNDGKTLANQPELGMDLTWDPYEASDSKVAVSILAWETNNYVVDIVLLVRRMPQELDRWRIATYKKLRTAYEEKVRQHAQRVAELTAEAEARAERETRRPFGSPPAENTKTIRAELKKHCISIITQQWYDAFDATRDGNPPFFDFEDAAAEGSYIRFFEHAFEWDQLQYLFYPYFWARKKTWIDRFVKQEVDPHFLEFLKAGSARVVVPVRPGFEVAVAHFLETGKLWGGEGEPPEINTPLYVSIVEEIRERTGAPQGELPVGDPWDVRVPTALAIARDGSDLPEWERVTAGEWSWRPVEAD